MSHTVEISGLHHVKVPVSDLPASRAWYERLLPLEVQLEFRDADGVVRGVAYEPTCGVAIALREDRDRAVALEGFNLLALLVDTHAQLVELAASLDERGIAHTGLSEATLGWMLAVRDPDGAEVKFYTAERHP